MQSLVMSWCSMIVCCILFNVVVLVHSSNTASGLTLRKVQKSIGNLAHFQSTGFSEGLMLRRAQKSIGNLTGFQSTGFSEDSKDQTATNNSVGSQSPSITAVCNQISITNARYQTAMHGTYEMLSSSYNCAGRQSYRRIGTSTDAYIFYLSYGAWGVGPSRCVDLLGIAAASTAASPDQVTSTWEEYDGTSWVDSSSLQVKCYTAPTTTTTAPTTTCEQISITNARYQTSMHGTYEMLSSSYNCAGRQSYRRIGTSTDAYIFYLSYGAWGVGPSRCVDLLGIAAASTAASPDQVTSTWQEYDGTSWVYSSSLQVKCYTAPPKTTTRSTTTTTTTTAPTTPCEQITVTNSRYQTDMHGTYGKLSSSNNCAGRQSYRRIGTSTYAYIFYLSYGAWGVGPSRCDDLLGIAAASTAASPDQVTSTWQEYDGTSWVYSSSLQVRCDYSSPESSGVRIYANVIPMVIVAVIMLIGLGV